MNKIVQIYLLMGVFRFLALKEHFQTLVLIRYFCLENISVSSAYEQDRIDVLGLPTAVINVKTLWCTVYSGYTYQVLSLKKLFSINLTDFIEFSIPNID